MIGADTNVLVRAITGDDPEQSPVASALIANAAENGESIYVSTIVLCELVWTLNRTYRLSRSQIVIVLDRVVEFARSPGVYVLEHDALVRQAVEAYRTGRADFSDYLVGLLGQAAGASTTYTFDRVAAATPNFKLLRRAEL